MHAKSRILITFTYPEEVFLIKNNEHDAKQRRRTIKARLLEKYNQKLKKKRLAFE